MVHLILCIVLSVKPPNTLVQILTSEIFSIFFNEISILVEFQEAHKLLQPADKAFKELAVEFAEYQVNLDS